MEIDKNQYLLDVLETHKMSKIQDEVDKFKERRDEIKDVLKEHYSSKMYDCFVSGSFAKHTAINIKYDMDVVVPFKKDNFDTLEVMFNDVYDFLKEKYPDANEIRKQKVSIGITFKKDNDNVEVQIDVVPGRELKDEDYKTTNDLNLYFNKDHWGFKKGSWQKTNIQAQIDNIKGLAEERKIIRLLKIWKKANVKDYKSFMLELFTIKALNGYNRGNGLWDKLKYTMEYISNNVTDESFKLVDPGNSNNNVLGSLNSTKRFLLSTDLKNIISNVESNDDMLKIYFPENSEFKAREDNNYGRSSVSYPPTGQRFGIL